ncbi:hypothetical protein GOP47_0024292 [Adiantum capillus-veneris]|uniref:GB1/RHD3-type G domain-containing protein n=1 Tax=Adiantum capillus-veneris TaxID=13818 RepID=A0A9D4Z491_ADICA|nr:hypothetical protein GOP47_0024292 [Adiantum capillus-veneris]
MDPDAVAALQLVKGPLGVVSVCGRARQGKSFILNQLLGKGSGFQVASTHRPCTKGLWMWSTPLKRIAADGTEYSLLLLDTEGIDAYDQTGTYSTQIFSLAVLLSSMFVYNQMGGIDEAALDRLSLVTEMTKHIRVRASQNRSSAAELGQYSPIFLWLLRDFYLELAEDGRRITPREYLESALQPMSGNGKAIAAKNEIRESIRALFPDRECFTLVRPLNEERDLQRLDKIPLEKMRPEFRNGLETLTRFIFERTRPKHLGSTIMTGPLLAGLTQSFLDALNAGAVPTIATSWQNVEENECRRAYDVAIQTYARMFNSPSSDEVLLQETYEMALQGALDVYQREAVGLGAARQKHEKLLVSDLKKRFEEYKRKVSTEAELKCVKAIETMDEKLRAACHSPAATLDQVLQVLNGLLVEYEQNTFGVTKWKKMAKFLQQSFEGPLSDLVKKWTDQKATDNTSLQLKCRSLEERLLLLGKQLDSAQRDVQDWKRRFETLGIEHKAFAEESDSRYSLLQNKYSNLEENAASLSYQLEIVRKEASDWRSKYDHLLSTRKAEEDRIVGENAALKSRCSSAEARLAAAREQAEAAKEEASEWRRKHDAALKESRESLGKASAMQESATKQAQAREDALRAEFSSAMALKEKELNNAHSKAENSEQRLVALSARLKDQEAEMDSQEEELVTLRAELRHLQTVVDAGKASLSSAEKELEIIKQEKVHIDERRLTELRRLEEAEEKCRAAENEAKRACEIADRSREAASLAEREKVDVERMAVERLASIERLKRHIEDLAREKGLISAELDSLRSSEQEAVLKSASAERRLEEREREMEELLQSAHEQRTNTVQVLESLLATERQARAEANARAEALSLQMQNTQARLDSLQQELTTVRLNETALETKLKAFLTEQGGGVGSSRSKRPRVDESIQDMDLDTDHNLRRRGHTGNAENGTPAEDTSTGANDNNPSDVQDYTKFTIAKLKQELTAAGYAEDLLQLRNPSKKDILSLYEKLVLKK